MSRLNYASHAIEGLKRLIRSGYSSASDRRALGKLILSMRQAQKFLLPDRGELIFDRGDMPLNTEVCRLPFPYTLVEFAFPAREAELRPDVETASSRRIALAIEGDYVSYDGCAGTFTPRQGGGGFVVQVVSYIDRLRMWLAMPAQAYISYSATTVRPNSSGSAFSKVKTSSATPFVMFGHLPTAFQAGYADPALGIDALSNDIAREINILTEFLSVISCANVSTQVDPASRTLNSARRTSKKEPFFDYHVLMIDGASGARGAGRGSSDAGTDGPKVRTHLRRGHIRRLHGSDRRIWVNATIVAPGSSQGIADKDYRVKASSAP